MPFQMNYTDEFEDNHPQSYWKIVQTNYSPIDQTGQITFYGYSSFDSKKQKQRPIGSRSYPLNADNVLLYFSTLTNGGVLPYDVIVQLCEELALGTKDVPTAGKDKDGKPIFESFFKNAIKV